jgi:hypothetical protein
MANLDPPRQVVHLNIYQLSTSPISVNEEYEPCVLWFGKDYIYSQPYEPAPKVAVPNYRRSMFVTRAYSAPLQSKT